MKMTLDQAELVLEQFAELQNRAAPIASKIFELKSGYPQGVDPEEVTLDGGDLWANWTEYQRCGNSEEHSIQIPLEYLFDDSWEAKAQAEIDAIREKVRIAKEAAEAKAQKAAEERERLRYLALKAKYGDE